jgi:HEPN domain-containing protein
VSAGEPALWLRLADEDLAMARLALDRGIYRQTCFHAQQAAEKALKALLLVRRGTYPRTHSLEDLLVYDTSGELSEWEES